MGAVSLIPPESSSLSPNWLVSDFAGLLFEVLAATDDVVSSVTASDELEVGDLVRDFSGLRVLEVVVDPAAAILLEQLK